MKLDTLKSIVEDQSTRSGKVFDYCIQALIVLSLVTFSLETLPNLSQPEADLLRAFEIFSVLIFTVEYILRLLIARPKKDFVFSFFGVVDLIAILPFYLSLGVDLRSVRAFRMLRLFRMLKLARYSRAIRRFHLAFTIAWEEMVLFASAAGIVLFLASAGIYHFEHQAQPRLFASVFHSLWWAVCTLTTVGYGDVYPIKPGGRIFTFVVLLVGLGIVAVPAGLVASALSKAREIEETTTSPRT